MIRAAILKWARARQPDFIIGGRDNPYLRRHWLLPRNLLFNVYVHEFLRGDDDRAEHTHPWANCSILLEGSYVEWQKGVPTRRYAGDVVVRRSGHIQHRIELTDGPCWTVFLLGHTTKNGTSFARKDLCIGENSLTQAIAGRLVTGATSEH